MQVAQCCDSSRRWLFGLPLMAAMAFPLGAEAAPEPAPAAESETEAQEAPLPWKVGPQNLQLGHDIQLALPENYQFLGQPQAGEIMRKMGNLYNDNLLGVVVPTAEKQDYFVTLRYDEEGYIKDDESLDGEEILSTIREGEEEYNEERKQAGFPPIHADGWQEVPHYDKGKHHLVWGLKLSDSDGSSLNYNTRVLGRKGYVSVNLVTDPANFAEYKPAAASLLAATSFVSGARYEDFDASNDKVAEYGLTGLVLGGAGLGAAKLAKVGLFAKFFKVILATLIAGKKFVVLALIGLAALIKKFFSRGNGQQPEA